MSDKNSRKTEDEMLDQTFGQYTDESTNTSEAETKVSDAKSPKKSLLNNNYVLFGGFGALIVVFVGYKLLTTPQPVKQPVIQQPIVQQPIEQNQQVNPTVNQFMNNNDGNNGNLEVKVGTAPVEIKAPTPVEIKAPTPVEVKAPTPIEVKMPTPVEVKMPTPVEIKNIQKVEINKIPQVASYNDDVKSQNANLIEQFEKMLSNKYDPKFEKIENSLNKQQEFNRTIEERLSRLESGKPTRVIKETNIVKENNIATNPVKVVKHVKTQVNNKVETVIDKRSKENEVIIDKRNTNNNVKAIVNAPKVETEVNYPPISVHSIFSGRLWTKNSDGSLSTYTVGDKLPSGEIIKKIDDTNYEVTTDKRKF
jgi:hypothetical protein